MSEHTEREVGREELKAVLEREEDKRLADALRWIEENAGDLLFLGRVGFRAYLNPPNKGCYDGRTPLEAIEAAMRAAGEDVG